MPHARIHIADTTVFRATFKDEDGEVVSIAGNSTLQFKFRKPDGTAATQNGSMTGDGTTGEMTFTPDTSFLDQVGNWEVQGYVVIPAGSYHSTVRQFRVYANVS